MKKNISLFVLTLIVVSLSYVSVVAQKFDDYKAFSSGTGNITAVAYNPAGNRFASGNENGTILVREAESGDIVNILKDHDKAITHLSYSNDGKHLISTSKDGIMHVWDLSSDDIVYSMRSPTPTGYFTFAYFSPDGQVVLFGGNNGFVMATRPFASNTKPSPVAPPQNSISSADYTKTGNFLAIASDNTVKIIDFYTQKVVKALTGCSGNVVDLKYNSSNDLLGVLCDDGNITLWDPELGIEITTWKVANNTQNTQIDFSPDGKYLVVGDGNNTAYVWDVIKQKLNSELKGHQASILSVDFAPNSKYIITGGADDQIKMWKWRKILPNEEIPQLPPTPEPVATNSTPSTPTEQAPEVLENISNKTGEFILEDLNLTFSNRNIPDSLGDRRVSSGKRMFVESKTIELRIWDNEYEDGDTISLLLNGEWLVKEYRLTNKKRKIEFSLDPNSDNYLVLFAHNEGERPPNTAAIAVFDGNKEKRMSLSSDLKKCDTINFKVKDDDD